MVWYIVVYHGLQGSRKHYHRGANSRENNMDWNVISIYKEHWQAISIVVKSTPTLNSKLDNNLAWSLWEHSS